MDRIRVGTATTGAIEYYPFHLALEGDYFKTEGLQVDLTTVSMGPALPELVRSGRVDIGLGGAWRPLMYRGRLDTFIPFVQLVGKCPASLILRREMKPFDWSALEGLTVLVGEGAPSPWMFLHGLLRSHGVEPGKIKWIHSLTGTELFELFRVGMGDVLLGSWVEGRQLLAEHKASHALSLASVGPSVPWSVFYAMPKFLQQTDLVLRFGKALQRAVADVLRRDPIDLQYVGSIYVEEIERHDLDQAVREFRNDRMWDTSLQIDEASLTMWQDWFVDVGILAHRLPYAEAVDTTIAAVSQRPG